MPTALELVNNSTTSTQLNSLEGAPSRSCPTGSQSKGHPARVGGLSPTSVNPISYKLGLQPLTFLPFLSLIIKKLVNQLNIIHYYDLRSVIPLTYLQVHTKILS